jgi:hypothetical protein
MLYMWVQHLPHSHIKRETQIWPRIGESAHERLRLIHGQAIDGITGKPEATLPVSSRRLLRSPALAMARKTLHVRHRTAE